MYADTSEGSDAPHLYLSGTRGTDGSSGLPAVFKNASIGSYISDEITFVYKVEFDDVLSGTFLEVEDSFAIRDGGAPLVDLLGREANVTLPAMGSNASLSASTTLSIDSAEPVITEISSSLNGGEYGVGQVSSSDSARGLRNLLMEPLLVGGVCVVKVYWPHAYSGVDLGPLRLYPFYAKTPTISFLLGNGTFQMDTLPRSAWLGRLFDLSCIVKSLDPMSCSRVHIGFTVALDMDRCHEVYRFTTRVHADRSPSCFQGVRVMHESSSCRNSQKSLNTRAVSTSRSSLSSSSSIFRLRLWWALEHLHPCSP